MTMIMATGLNRKDAVRKKIDGVQVSRCDVGHCEQRATVCGEPVPAALSPAAAQEILQEAGARSCQGKGPVRSAADYGKGPCAAMSCFLRGSAKMQQLMGVGRLAVIFCLLQSA